MGIEGKGSTVKGKEKKGREWSYDGPPGSPTWTELLTPQLPGSVGC